MEERKYYPTELIDLFLGYQLEVYVPSKGFVQGEFPEILYDHKDLDQFSDVHQKAAHAVIRTKYLDKEDIESLGWRIKTDRHSRASFEWPDPKNLDSFRDFYGYYCWGLYLTYYGDGACTIEAKFSSDHPEVIFDGEIKSVNELKTIMRFLKIGG